MSREFHCIEFRWRDGTISYTPVDKNHPDAFLVREVDEAKDAATLKREVDPKYDEAVKRLWEDMATLANCLSDPKWKQFAKESYENWEKTLK